MSSLTVDQLRDALRALNLDSRGNKATLKVRLGRAIRSSASPSPPPLPTATAPRPRPRLRRPPGQCYDSFLVFDVEATCIDGLPGRIAFSYPNEIIEWPVILCQWRCKNDEEEEKAGDSEEQEVEEQEVEEQEEEWELVKVDEFHSFVKPMWKPQLSPFCTKLTGIQQSDVDPAPTFPELCKQFYRDFCIPHYLFTAENKTAWVTDGPWDLRDFIAKQCYLSKVPRPPWLAGEMVDLRITISNFFSSLKEQRKNGRSPSPPTSKNSFAALDEPSSLDPLSPSPVAAAAAEQPPPTPLAAPADLLPSPPTDTLPSSSAPPPPYLPSHALTAPSTLSLPDVLLALTLPPFQGRLHSGLSDARNASRILIDLAARGVALEPNRRIPEGGKGGREKRWGWMSKTGEVKWEEFRRWENRRQAEEAASGRGRGKKGPLGGYVSKEEGGG
ncbi:hypothetical protein JCM6882_009534 [Rhodosporidiobolus microsporus]